MEVGAGRSCYCNALQFLYGHGSTWIWYFRNYIYILKEDASELVLVRGTVLVSIE
jgi:hypothetical protein